MDHAALIAHYLSRTFEFGTELNLENYLVFQEYTTDLVFMFF
jgi:hypothetical protein